MNDNLDNISRIQKQLSPNSVVLLAADILRLKDTIDMLCTLTKDIGEAVCVNSEALKEIVEVLAANNFYTDDTSGENPELDLVERFNVWCDVTKHLQRTLAKHQESTKVDLSIQRDRWDVQKQINENVVVELNECKSRIDAIMTQHKGLQATLLELINAMQEGKIRPEVVKHD